MVALPESLPGKDSLESWNSHRRKPQNQKRHGIWIEAIEGRYRKITVHQLAIAWWLFQSKHLTKRQLRVYFAAHEMAERRRYAKTNPDPDRRAGGRESRRKPLYTLDEIKSLVGGRNSKTANAALSADVKALGRLGLVKIMPHAIEFAVSIDQIALEDVTGFWSFFDEIPNRNRSIPIPRRTCRALAGGFPTAVMAMMIALMIRSLFWHRSVGEEGQGGYRIDGRTKCSWIADVFGVSRRAVTDARTRLIELGWITPIDAPQWELNKWGQRYQLNVDTFGPSEVQNPIIDEPDLSGEIASPESDNSGETASLCLNKSSSLKGNIKTRNPAPTRAETSGVLIQKDRGSRRINRGGACSGSASLWNIREEDLRDTQRLLVMYHQAVERKLVTSSEAGWLNFLALAERARAHGRDASRLFFWLLKNQRWDFITQSDEDAALARLRLLRDGPRKRITLEEPAKATDIALSEDERLVRACIIAGKQANKAPFRLAQMWKGWTIDRWELAFESYQQKENDRWTSNAV